MAPKQQKQKHIFKRKQKPSLPNQIYGQAFEKHLNIVPFEANLF